MHDKDFTPDPHPNQHNITPQIFRSPHLSTIEEVVSVATDHATHIVRLSSALSAAATEPQPHLTATRIAQASFDAGLCKLFAIDRQAIVDLLTWNGGPSDE